MARRLDQLDDSRLAARVRAGDEAAFEVLYDRHHRSLLSFCRHMLGNAEDGEDALQQTFLRAHGALRGGQLPEAVRPWLYAIARNRCKTMLAARREALSRLRTSSRRSTGSPTTSRARRPARTGRRPRAPARGPARRTGAVRARRHVAGRDRDGDRRALGQGQGARLPGPYRADGRARRPIDALRPRSARNSRSRAAARCGAGRCAATSATASRVRPTARLSPASARASPSSCRSPPHSASRPACWQRSPGRAR